MTHQTEFSSVSLPLSPSVLEKLAAASTVEEVKAVLTMTEKEQETEAPAKKAYREIWESLAELEDAVIGRNDAAEKYDLDPSTIKTWEQRGRIRVAERAMGRGKQVQIKERDLVAILEFNKRYRKDKTGGGMLPGWLPKGKPRTRKKTA